MSDQTGITLNNGLISRSIFAACSLACCLLVASTALAEPQWIRPGEVWPDDRGQHVQAHGGGVILLDGVYYWFGEDRSRDIAPDQRAVACYSSRDLAHWTFRNRVLEMTSPQDWGKDWVLERPKVFYNRQAKQYVMYMHLDGQATPTSPRYSVARVGVAVCDTVDGDYRFLRSFRPLEKESRDIGQFIDDDGSAYLIFEDRRSKGFHIAALSDDYLAVDHDVCFIQEPIEGGALAHVGALYYVVGSHLTGWNPNPNKYATAKSLAGPWSEFRDIAPPETNTYNSQSTMMMKVVGTKATTVILLCDQWKPRAQWDSRYLWMPLEIGDGKLWLPRPRPWTLNIKTGESVLGELEKPTVQP